MQVVIKTFIANKGKMRGCVQWPKNKVILREGNEGRRAGVRRVVFGRIQLFI
jgi:hypothetical protein